MKSLVCIGLLLVGCCVATAQDSSNPREQLKQYVSDLQKSPDDQALREKIIKLVIDLEAQPPTRTRNRFTSQGKAQTKTRRKGGG